jgi:hypothetical protein
MLLISMVGCGNDDNNNKADTAYENSHDDGHRDGYIRGYDNAVTDITHDHVVQSGRESVDAGDEYKQK